MRGSRYYAQLRVDLSNGHTAPRRLVLKASNLDEAKGELERKRTERRDGRLLQRGQRPTFDDFSGNTSLDRSWRRRKSARATTSGQAIGRWSAHLGGVRLDKITPPLIHGYREKRLKGGASARTVNLDTVALRNVLKLARDREVIKQMPEVKQLKQKPRPGRRC